MLKLNPAATSLVALFIMLAAPPIHAQAPATPNAPVAVSVAYRSRIDTWQWFAAPPQSETYAYLESLLRVAVSQKIHNWDWRLELSQPAILDAPSDAISPIPAQGQLGLGATYYAANGNNSYPAAAFFKQGFLRYHFGSPHKSLRIGRFEFFEGQEIPQKNPTLAWLQSNRVAQHLIGNFGFTNAQRSVDGIEGHYGAQNWDISAAAARSDQGVFNMNGNPELDVDFQYLALTRSDWNQRLLWRVFAAGYHDGRTGITKTDNRPLAERQADHNNIRIGTFGGDLITAIPAGPGTFDFLFWGAVQNGSWGTQSNSANAVAIEGGYRFGRQPASPWLRGGWFRSSGDDNPTDATHNTFFQMLPTPRVYARLPIYNLMNNSDEFVQLIDRPLPRLTLRSDLHWVQLTSSKDLWYQGGGAFDNKVFGFVGRPANNASSLSSVIDISADWQATKALAVNFYYGYAQGKSVVAAIYPVDSNTQYGFVEFDYHWGMAQRSAPAH